MTSPVRISSAETGTTSISSGSISVGFMLRPEYTTQKNPLASFVAEGLGIVNNNLRLARSSMVSIERLENG
jgi:hypothetical protein